MNTFKAVWVGLALVLTAVSGVRADEAKPDYAKEQRWAEQIVDFLIDGDPVWLQANRHKFLGIYTEAYTNKRLGAVILIHGGGVHPDWQQVMKPLRTALPGQGWATLAIQMPVLPNGTDERAYVPLFKYVPARIDAAVRFLRKHNVNNIVLLGHSLGASMASDYLAHSQQPGIRAFVGIGMKGIPQPNEFAVLDNAKSLVRINIPVLDIYGSNSNEEVIGSVHRRAFALKSVGAAHSRQVYIKNADHYFEGHEKQLDAVINDWLKETLLTRNTANR
jgi:pimeloyl-ACP methyl ester carboxylesterase